MLGKLLKHEWKSVSKVLAVLNLVLILMTVIGCCVLNTNIFNNVEAIPLAVVLIIFYALSLSTLAIVTFIYLYIRFYKNLFTAEGYLMHTLPVSPTQLFHSKLIVGYFWGTLNSILIILSVTALAFVTGYHFVDTHDTQSVNQVLEDSGMIAFATTDADWTAVFQEIFHYTPMQFFLMFLLLILVSSFVTILIGYISILLGQLVEKYKLAAAIGFYVVIYVIEQIICSLIVLVPSFQVMLTDIDAFFPGFYKNMIPFSILGQVLMGIISYVAAIVLMRRKVNLD